MANSNMQGFSGNIHTSPYARRTSASGPMEAHPSAIGGNNGGNANSGNSAHSSRYSQIVIKEPNTAEPKKAKRKRITPEQLKELTSIFEKTDTPTHDIREELSKKLNMTNREVQVWFQNRRAKYNRMRIEHQRQIRNNAAIIYNTGMMARGPVAAVPPPPSTLQHHQHHQHPQQQMYQQLPLSSPASMSMAQAPASATAPGPGHCLAPAPAVISASSQVHAQSASYLHLQPFAAAQPRYIAGNAAPVRRSSVQQLHSHVLSSRNRSCSSDILPMDAYRQGMSPDAASTMVALPRSPSGYSPPLPGHSAVYTPPATAYAASMDKAADADAPDSQKMAVQTRFLAADGTLPCYQRLPQQQPEFCIETGTPAFTPVSATSVHMLASKTGASGFPARSSNSPYSQNAPELTPDCAYKPDDQQMDGRRAPDEFPQVGRRNTVSSYHSVGYSYVGDAAGSSSAGHAPLPDCSAVVASPPPPGHYSSVAEARSRYMPKMPASGYHCHHRLSTTNRSQSPPTSHRRHYAHHIHTHAHSHDHCLRSPAAAAATAADFAEVVVSSDSMQVQPAIPTCQSAISGAPVSGRELRLPSIRAILAETSESADQSVDSSNGRAQTSANKASYRMRSHTSPPPAHAEAQPPTDTSRAHADTRAESAVQVTHPSSPHAQCYQDSQIIEAKMGIDVLATAAISVSSIKNSISLPHLTPLSEFALRNAAQQQQQHCLTAPASPRQSQDERQHLPSSSKSKEGACPETRSQRVTPANSREKTPHGWRPW
ncbi:hypothetical protein LPJ75_000857 [Coemansia sp. RSA 2598]|nr:hypothetical protein LPJ75_000857 [Coemansia sp. RSA 2598]